MKLTIHRAVRVRTGNRLRFECEIPPGYAELYEAILRKSPDRLDVTIATPSRPRTTGDKSQNHHLNGHCMQIAQATGNSFDDVKLYVKRAAFSLGLPMATRPDGTPVLSLNDGQPIPISESDMDVQQCGWCIECAHVLAGELGVVLVEE